MASPIESVQPCDENGTTTGSAVTNLPTPAKFVWSQHDISGSGAGRLESMKMIKMRQGQSRSIDVEWPYPTLAEASSILTAFDSEYVKVKYIDAKAGSMLTKVFYVGDRVSPLWNSTEGRWERLGFTIIQQTAD